MAGSVLVDTGFLVALLSARDAHHGWATETAQSCPPPWRTCEAVLSEAFHLLAESGVRPLAELVRRHAVVSSFVFREDFDRPLALMAKYAQMPMSFADACLVRMTETLVRPLVLTTDTDFRIYRRHGRQSIPCMLPA